ncbi:MAG: recombinase, partial [Sutterella sp.]
MSEKATSSKYSFPQVTLDFDTLLADVLPAAIAQPLAAFGLLTAEDLYECVAATGATWFRNVLGISASCATELMYWFAD